MAELISKEKYKGRLGGLDLYELNGKIVVRVRRSKMSKSQKAKVAKTSYGKACKSNGLGSKFSKALRLFVDWRFQADTMYYSRLTGHIVKNLMKPTPENGGPGTRSILPEHVHRLSSFTANTAFPEKVLGALRKTKFTLAEKGITVKIPALPVSSLTGSSADFYRVSVFLKLIDLKTMKIGWKHRNTSAPIPFGEEPTQKMFFSRPEAKPDEVMVAVVGIQSLCKGKMVEDVGMNGFVFLGI